MEKMRLRGALWEPQKCLPEHGTVDRQLHLSHTGKAIRDLQIHPRRKKVAKEMQSLNLKQQVTP